VSTDPIRQLRAAKRRSSAPQPPPEELAPNLPIVTQGARSEPPGRPPPTPDDLLRAAVDEARGRPRGWQRIF
jgi:hypothetical protein